MARPALGERIAAEQKAHDHLPDQLMPPPRLRRVARGGFQDDPQAAIALHPKADKGWWEGDVRSLRHAPRGLRP